jgi:hypothetical protein
MVEPEKSGEADQHAIEAADCVGLLVKLDIRRFSAPRGDPGADVDDAAHVGGLEDVLRLVEADFRQLTVPLLGRSERVLPSRSFFRLRRVLARWRDLLFEKTGDASLFRVCVRLEPSASDADLRPERNSDLTDEGPKRGPQIDIQIQNVGGEPVSSRALLGRFHPDHREPTFWDAIDYARRLEEERRKKNEGGA